MGKARERRYEDTSLLEKMAGSEWVSKEDKPFEDEE